MGEVKSIILPPLAMYIKLFVLVNKRSLTAAKKSYHQWGLTWWSLDQETNAYDAHDI